MNKQMHLSSSLGHPFFFPFENSSLLGSVTARHGTPIWCSPATNISQVSSKHTRNFTEVSAKGQLQLKHRGAYAVVSTCCAILVLYFHWLLNNVSSWNDNAVIFPADSYEKKQDYSFSFLTYWTVWHEPLRKRWFYHSISNVHDTCRLLKVPV